MDSPYGEYCKKCSPGVGCTIHDSRPEPCKVFQCCYTQMERVNPVLRPDKCGVVFEKITDTLILGTTVDVITDISELIQGQIRSFVSEGISVMYQQFNPYKWTCFLVKGANKEKIISALRKKANDSSKLY